MAHSAVAARLVQLLIIVAAHELVHVRRRVASVVLLHHVDILRVEEIPLHRLVREPHYLAHMQVALHLRTLFKIVHRIKAHQIEAEGVGHDVLPVHALALRLGIILPVQRIVLAEIFVDGDSYRAVTYYNTLIQCADLHIHGGYDHPRQQPLQIVERRIERGVDVVNVSILRLCVGDKRLQDGVLIERKELLVYLRIIHLAQLQHVFDERARLHRIVGVHLLKGGKVARRQILAFKTVVARHLHTLVLTLRNVKGLKLELARLEHKHHAKQYEY